MNFSVVILKPRCKADLRTMLQMLKSNNESVVVFQLKVYVFAS